MATESAMNAKREKRMAAMEERLTHIEEKQDHILAAIAALPKSNIPAGNIPPAEVKHARK